MRPGRVAVAGKSVRAPSDSSDRCRDRATANVHCDGVRRPSAPVSCRNPPCQELSCPSGTLRSAGPASSEYSCVQNPSTLTDPPVRIRAHAQQQVVETRRLADVALAGRRLAAVLPDDVVLRADDAAAIVRAGVVGHHGRRARADVAVDGGIARDADLRGIIPLVIVRPVGGLRRRGRSGSSRYGSALRQSRSGKPFEAMT